MELEDCAFPLVQGIIPTDDPNVAFKDVNYALLVGSRPRSKGMERKDLIEANAAIFSVQGKAVNDGAARDVKVLVVGNPANTVPHRPAQCSGPRSSSVHGYDAPDHNRAAAQLAAKTGAHVTEVEGLCIWGNHSATQYPDIHRATVKGAAALDLVDQAWYADTFIPAVQQRGAAIIEARGALVRRPPLTPPSTCAIGPLVRRVFCPWASTAMVAMASRRG